jgi:phospholipid/cholesterol/gamma-HCH transport system ATP-binding protein
MRSLRMQLAPPGFQPDDHIFVDNVTKRFGEAEVLRGVTLHLKKRQTAVIIGGSGAGKTTLLRMLIALEKPTTGRIFVEGEDIAPLGEVELNRVRQKFGMVFQYAALLDSLTIFDNVAFPLREHRKSMSRKDMRTKVLDMLKLLGLEGKHDAMPSQLSGGQRKRVGLARALMLEPRIIVYDEPTSGLDPITSRMVDDLIEETRDRFGVTSVVISHDMTSTFRIAHQAFLLVKGKIIAEGKPDDLAYGDCEEARQFIAASGISPETLNRVDRAAEDGSKTISYKAM